MKYIDRDDISEIFVGRKKILTSLQKRLNKKNNSDMSMRPHFVYTLLNTPGIGKTKAVNYFENNLMKILRISLIGIEVEINF